MPTPSTPAPSTPEVESVDCPDAPRWRRRSEARPAEIAEAALGLFTERGFAATRVGDIAARAGVTKGTVYLYFPSKEDLFREAVRARVTPLLSSGEALVAEYEGPSDELLRRLFRVWWSLLSRADHMQVPKLMMSEAAHFPNIARFYVEEVVQRARRLFAGAVQRGIDRGEFRAVDAPTVARLATAPLLHALVYQQSLQPFDEPLNNDTLLSSHIDLFLHGLRPEGPLS
jgi:AcrR family transcriptional regulator